MIDELLTDNKHITVTACWIRINNTVSWQTEDNGTSTTTSGTTIESEKCSVHY